MLTSPVIFFPLCPRELGMDLGDDLFAPSAWHDGVEIEGTGSAARGPVESARPKALHGGCVPLEWTCGAFTGAVPPQHACAILDWAIVTEERYAGNIYSCTSAPPFFCSSKPTRNSTCPHRIVSERGSPGSVFRITFDDDRTAGKAHFTV